jgi:predicted ribosome quality control (RQC) complex YloA/Tae2 family protein
MKPISTFIFEALLKELKQLEGAYVEKVQQVGPELFKFSLSGNRELLIEVGKRLNQTSFKIEAPKKPSQAAMLLRKYLGNKKLLKIEQHNHDRVVLFDFGVHKLIGEFFSHGNIVLADKDLKIVFCFRPEEWKDRKIARGKTYKFPQNPIPPVKKDFSPMTEEFAAKYKTMNEAVDDFYALQKKENPWLEKLKRRLEKQLAALTDFENKAAECRQIGDAILQNYEKIEKAKERKKGKISVELT